MDSAVRVGAIVGIVISCHDRTMRQAVRCNAEINALSPQALTAI